MLDLLLFKEMLEIDSTSGLERPFAEFLSKRLLAETNGVKPLCSVKTFEVGDGTLNILFSWGKPKVYLCTHLDTVPPYIKPEFLKDRVLGRGSCDAKGQIFSMFTACLELQKKGINNFGLLLLAGEETGSFGAKAYTRDCEGGDIVIVGEPTDNKVITASKGTKSFKVEIKGKPCHSGYPSLGESAVEDFIDFMIELRKISFPKDNILGETTYNIGNLQSQNPQNVLSPYVSFSLYFRTTQASDNFVVNKIMSMQNEKIKIENRGGDTPMSYYTFQGINQGVVSFGSDAPRLEKFKYRALCGPGSIFVAHTDGEYILLSDIEKAVNQYVYMIETFLTKE